MQTLLPLPKTDRIGRYPKHTFQTKELVYTAQPFCIAPVRPGETLTNLYFESRVISDPVLNPIIGVKKEYYFFYVRITDLLVDAIRDMFVDDTNTDITATLGVGANDTAYYTAKGAVDYLKRGTQKIVNEYFRDEGEVYSDYANADGTYRVQFREDSWMDSLTDKDAMPEGAAIAGATDAGDLERLMNAFEMARSLGIANMSYEDWLRTNGIIIPEKDENKPKLLARFSDFTYPSNTIDPTDGSPTSAWSWVFKNGNSDRHFFKEPGFIIGLSITRPKVYFSGLAGSACEFLTRPWDWLTNISQAVDPATRLKKFTGDTGPLGDRTTVPDDYWVDMGDVFVHGDQFQNVVAFNVVPASTGTYNMIAGPSGSTFKWKYPTEAECKQFFVDYAGTAFYVKQDGYVSFNVKTDIRDMTQVHTAVV